MLRAVYPTPNPLHHLWEFENWMHVPRVHPRFHTGGERTVDGPSAAESPGAPRREGTTSCVKELRRLSEVRGRRIIQNVDGSTQDDSV